MNGLGTIANVLAIIAGGLIGILFRSRIKTSYRESLMHANGICVFLIGVGGAIEEMLKADHSGSLSGGILMMIISFGLGTFSGELINIEGQLEKLGQWLKTRLSGRDDGGFVNAFVTASLVVCIGAMAVVGSIQDGLRADHSILFAKAILDFVIILVMSASMGKGCVFSAIPVALFQGSITISAKMIGPLMTEQALANISLTGSAMIACIGINILWGTKIKVANMLPTLAFAGAMAFIAYG